MELSYGPNSQSRGIANIIFHKPDGASVAFNKLNGLLVDNRPIKVSSHVSRGPVDGDIDVIRRRSRLLSARRRRPA